MNQQVAKNNIVTLDYNVTDPDGVLVDAGEEPLVYLHGGYDDIFPMIEEALQGKKVGETISVKMQPDDAFGEYDAELIEIEAQVRTGGLAVLDATRMFALKRKGFSDSRLASLLGTSGSTKWGGSVGMGHRERLERGSV